MDNLGQPKLSRRKFVQRSVMAGAATSLLPGTSRAAKTTPSVPTGPNLYEQLGEIEYAFTGAVTGSSMSGTVDLGEYGQAQWSAAKAT